jgi:hypothetical protein
MALFKNTSTITLIGIEPDQVVDLDTTDDGYLCSQFARSLVTQGHLVKVKKPIDKSIKQDKGDINNGIS